MRDLKARAVKTKHRYVVITPDDPIFSRIERLRKDTIHNGVCEPMTFEEAKRALLNDAKDQICEWKLKLKRIRKLTKEEVDLESERT